VHPLPRIDDIKADFDFLESWEDRYRYVMELGRDMAAFPEALRVDANKVRGCASQVWLSIAVDRAGSAPRLSIVGDSDSHLVRGLVALLITATDGLTADEVLAFDAHKMLAGLGLAEHLTPQRSNGFASMVERIRQEASAANN
jgi:cysteine desulfuration protein SufE